MPHARFPQAGQVIIQPLSHKRLLQTQRFGGRHDIIGLAVPQQQWAVGQTRQRVSHVPVSERGENRVDILRLGRK
ncbi:hypothetical protein D3C87_2052670 [compost metagenome]